MSMPSAYVPPFACVLEMLLMGEISQRREDDLPCTIRF